MTKAKNKNPIYVLMPDCLVIRSKKWLWVKIRIPSTVQYVLMPHCLVIRSKKWLRLKIRIPSTVCPDAWLPSYKKKDMTKAKNNHAINVLRPDWLLIRSKTWLMLKITMPSMSWGLTALFPTTRQGYNTCF